MKIYNRILIIFMIGFVALSHCGCAKQKPSKLETMPIVIQADEPLKKQLETAVKTYPKETAEEIEKLTHFGRNKQSLRVVSATVFSVLFEGFAPCFP